MEFLKALSIQKENEGSSTGTKWIASNGNLIHSLSPVDTQMIGTVKSTDKAAY
jgi:aldehyde dehydrogenase (NAD+)